MMDGTMKEKDKIREELTELLNTYYNGSFVQLVCDYIRSTGMTPQEVERMLEEMRKVKGARSPFVILALHGVLFSSH